MVLTSKVESKRRRSPGQFPIAMGLFLVAGVISLYFNRGIPGELKRSIVFTLVAVEAALICGWLLVAKRWGFILRTAIVLTLLITSGSFGYRGTLPILRYCSSYSAPKPIYVPSTQPEPPDYEVPATVDTVDTLASEAKQKPTPGPVSAKQTLQYSRMADGLQASAWASEPALVRPACMDIDSRGRIWVAEANNRFAAQCDRIVILEDTHHTGFCDSVKVFSQDANLHAPLGICVLGNKVIISASPDLLIYTMDATGDKPEGPPQKLFTGFGGVKNDHGLHSGVFGPDGRFYFTCGNEGPHGDLVRYGDLLPQYHGDPVHDASGWGIGLGANRVRTGKETGPASVRGGLAMSTELNGSDFQVIGYNFRNNYELAVDSYGTVWQSDNDDNGYQGCRMNYVMEGEAQSRNVIYVFKRPISNF